MKVLKGIRVYPKKKKRKKKKRKERNLREWRQS